MTKIFFSMTLRAASVLAICSVLAQTGCDKNPLGTVESYGRPPVVSRAQLTPAAVFIDTIAPANGLYTVSTTLSAKVTDPDGPADIRSVLANVVGPQGDRITLVSLRDDGTSPDSAPGDGIYSTRLVMSLTRAMIGRFYPYVVATDGSGLESNAVAPSMFIFRKNAPPKLGALVAPDTLLIPSGGTAKLFMTLAASDSDGLADIKEVFFTSPEGSNPTFHFDMKDDGGATQPPSGDVTANDSVFSIVIGLTDSPTIRGRYRFVFQAIDASGDTSATLQHFITVI